MNQQSKITDGMTFEDAIRLMKDAAQDCNRRMAEKHGTRPKRQPEEPKVQIPPTERQTEPLDKRQARSERNKQIALAHIAEGKSAIETGKIMGISPVQIYRYARSAGIEPPPYVDPKLEAADRARTALLDYLKAHGPVTTAAASVAVGISPYQAKEYIKTFTARGMVKAKRQMHGPSLYSVTEEGE